MMATSYFLQLLLVLTTCTAALAANESPMAPAPGPSSSTAASFLHACCASVQRSDACYRLLLPYADSFRGSLARVARTSAGLASARQHAFSDDLARLKQHGTGAGGIADEALVACFDTVASTEVVFAHETLGQLDDLVAGVKSRTNLESDRFLVRTSLYSSASAMMDCVDWIHGAGEAARSSPVLKEVIAGCTTVAPYFEIAGDLTTSIKFDSL